MTPASPEPDLVDQQNDIVFKLLMQRYEPLLASMLEAVLAEPVADFTVLNPELPGDLPGGRAIIVDILVKLGDGRRVNVEMQVRARPELRPRLPYYMARNLSEQLHRGDNYGLVCPSIAVVWLAEPLFPELEQFHSIFELRDRQTHFPYGPELTLHLLQLAKLTAEVAHPLAKPAPTSEPYAALTALWGRFFSAKTRLDFVELRGQHPIMSQAVDALEELSSDPEVRRRAEKRRLDLVFYEMGLEMARHEERKKGLEQGLEQGRELGRAQGATSLLLRQLERKFGPLGDVAARVQAAPLHDIERWSERILDAATLSDVFGG